MTRNLIEFSNKNNVKKIVFLSSMEVYGLIKKKIVARSLYLQGTLLNNLDNF